MIYYTTIYDASTKKSTRYDFDTAKGYTKKDMLNHIKKLLEADQNLSICAQGTDEKSWIMTPEEWKKLCHDNPSYTQWEYID